MTAPRSLAAAVEAALGRPLGQLTPTEANDVAARLRAIVDALEAPTTPDAEMAARLTETADLVEHRAGSPHPS